MNSDTRIPKYCIILSTYKNHDYLEELIDSIECQTNADWVVYWREDSSSENIILENKDNRFIKHCDLKTNNKNIGVRASFLELLKFAPLADYYIFCDQDDIWCPNRLESISFEDEIPGILVQNGLIIEQKKTPSVKKIIDDKEDFGLDILFNNPVPGCCIVLNNVAKNEFVCSKQLHRIDVILHDWLLMNFALSHKWNIHFDKNPLFFYRIHDNNTIGLPGPVNKIKKLILEGGVIRYILQYHSIIKYNFEYYCVVNRGTRKSTIKSIALLRIAKTNILRFIFLFVLGVFI